MLHTRFTIAYAAEGFWTLLTVLCLSFVLAAACSPAEMVRDTEMDESFHASDRTTGELISELDNYRNGITALKGRARTQLSSPGESERATVSFSSTREKSLLEIRNQLGIEGGRILSNPDSVLIYNRMENYAQKMDRQMAAHYYLSGITALNLVDILHPSRERLAEARVLESRNHYMLVTPDEYRYYFDRDDLILKRTEYPVQDPEAFSTFLFEDYVEVDGAHVPRRIQILSSDEKTSIFLMIRSLEVNPDELTFDIDIPDDITIERL